MSAAARILIIDDEELFLDIYRQLLTAEGYEVHTATSAAAALEKLQDTGWDVVLLDRKLQKGVHSADTGLDLLDEVARRAPLAKTIVVTGVPDAAGVNRAFQQGAWDHLEKNAYLGDLLRIKLRHALEGTRERRLAALGNGKTETSLRALWAEALAATNSNEKGRLLEQFLLLLFRSITGFDDAVSNPRTPDEEFDIVIRNESNDATWRQEGTYILVEAKNWTSKVGPEEFDRFQKKIQRRSGRSKLGFFVSVNGFTAGFTSHALAERKENSLIVPLDRHDLEALLAAGKDGRNAKLKELHQRSVAGH